MADLHLQSSSNLRIVLVGKTGSGKSSAGNVILGRDVFETDLSPQSLTKQCYKRDGERHQRPITVIDTPGIFDTRLTETQVKAEIEKCICLSAPGPHVFLLVIRLGVRFTAEEKNSVKRIQEQFGEDASLFIIILFTHADQLKGKPVDQYLRESEHLRRLVNSCGWRYHVFNSKDIDDQTQVKELLRKIDAMLEWNGQPYYTNEMYEEAQRKIEEEKERERKEEEEKSNTWFSMALTEAQQRVKDTLDSFLNNLGFKPMFVATVLAMLLGIMGSTLIPAAGTFYACKRYLFRRRE